VNSPGDSFAWPFQDPGWFGKMVLQGLILIIPIVGWIAIYGWLLMTIDNYRAGRRELPPAGFHLSRGVALFVVYLVYAIIIEIPGGIVLGIGAGNHSSGLAAVGYAIDSLAGLLILFLLPSIILSTYRSGFAGGFDVAAVWAMATRDPGTTVIARAVPVRRELDQQSRNHPLLRRPAFHHPLRAGDRRRRHHLVRAAAGRACADAGSAGLEEQQGAELALRPSVHPFVAGR